MKTNHLIFLLLCYIISIECFGETFYCHSWEFSFLTAQMNCFESINGSFTTWIGRLAILLEDPERRIDPHYWPFFGFWVGRTKTVHLLGHLCYDRWQLWLENAPSKYEKEFLGIGNSWITFVEYTPKYCFSPEIDDIFSQFHSIPE